MTIVSLATNGKKERSLGKYYLSTVYQQMGDAVIRVGKLYGGAFGDSDYFLN
jgi:hypothetical protein